MEYRTLYISKLLDLPTEILDPKIILDLYQTNQYLNILLSSNKSIYDKFLIEDIKDVIANILLQVIDDLNVITIRIHIQLNELYNTFTLLIEKNNIIIINPDI